jgi:phosphoribosylformylglycinamidine synthase PurS subunit
MGWVSRVGAPIASSEQELRAVARVIVEVMPKPEILDPQGKAVAGALPRLGFTGFASVRQGKRFELEVDGEITEEVLEQARTAAAEVLSNPVIEDVVSVHVEGQA